MPVILNYQFIPIAMCDTYISVIFSIYADSKSGCFGKEILIQPIFSIIY